MLVDLIERPNELRVREGEPMDPRALPGVVKVRQGLLVNPRELLGVLSVRERVLIDCFKPPGV